MFVWIDWLALVVVLLVSSLIGLYYGCYGGKQKTMTAYLLGGRQMSVIPIAISVAIGHVSAVAFIGVPADVYKHGAYFWYVLVATAILTIISMFVFFPIFYKSKITSAYEYLEKRFDKRVRKLSSLFYILYENLQLPVVAFGPSLALSVATGIDFHLITIVLCGICIFYTAIGGLRSVIWTDLFQFLVVAVSVCFVLSLGSNAVGGFSSVWNTAVEGGRLDIFDFDINPTKKDSFWINIIGLTARFLYYYCLSQASVQKYLSLPTFKDCIISMILAAIVICFLMTLGVILGLVVYANFANCDPILSKQITKYDQIVPYLIAKLTKDLPGINGLFIAALVSLSLSTISSSLNSLTSVICKDFILTSFGHRFNERQSVVLLKVVVLIQGVVIILVTFMMPHLGDILALAVGVTGLLDGPSVGLFTLAAVFPSVTSQGAFFGCICGVILMAIIYFPAMYYQYNKRIFYPAMPVSVNGCSLDNVTYLVKHNHTLVQNNDPPFALFRISVNYYCLIGTLATILFGLIISRFTRKEQQLNDKTTHEPLMVNKL